MIRQYRNHPEASLCELLKWSEVPKSTFYYKRGEGKRGRKPTLVTANTKGEIFDNMKVVESMETQLQQEFCCYGYHNMCDSLQDLGWIINHKKVYRLMSVHNLLFNRKIGQVGIPRQYVRFRKIKAQKPLEHLCMDIKYVHIHGAGRNALLLTVIDVYSRKVLIHMLKFNIRKGDVIVMLSLLLLEYKIKGMTIRNDNGSQFIATVVREYLKEKKVNQEFTHVATPEENAYIEALHSIIQREVIERFEFDSLYHAQMIFLPLLRVVQHGQKARIAGKKNTGIRMERKSNPVTL